MSFPRRLPGYATGCSQRVRAGTWASLPLSATYSNPKKRICSHTQESSSKMIMAGKAKPNQEAKFTTLPFWGKILKGNKGRCMALPGDRPAPFVPCQNADPLPLNHSRVDLALQHQVGGGAGQGGDAPNAGRVAHTQAQALAEAELLLVLLCLGPRRSRWSRAILLVVWEQGRAGVGSGCRARFGEHGRGSMASGVPCRLAAQTWSGGRAEAAPRSGRAGTPWGLRMK